MHPSLFDEYTACLLSLCLFIALTCSWPSLNLSIPVSDGHSVESESDESDSESAADVKNTPPSQNGKYPGGQV